MRIPPPLQSGDLIALASPARAVGPDEVEYFVRYAREHGWRVRIDEVCFARHNQFGGPDPLRAGHMQTLLDDPEVKAIFCCRGGYGSLRIVDSISFERFLANPKWLVGFSDITVFHAHLQAHGVGSLHAPMPFNFGANDKALFHLVAQFLEGQPVHTNLPPHEYNIPGSATGVLTGGNLSMLYALKGSPSLPNMKDMILFLEDVDEYLYHIDRMMLSLKRAGVFGSLAGLIVGAFTQMKDNTIPFGQTAEQIISAHTKEFGFPVCFGFPAGHIDNQQPLLLGGKIQIQVRNDGASLVYT
ncbi:MAG TPA: LD-carboxypeptidase [Bacteroidales bacterium]|nr:LD-carboxypeptidase [Bacteroidales bacterium]